MTEYDRPRRDGRDSKRRADDVADKDGVGQIDFIEDECRRVARRVCRA